MYTRLAAYETYILDEICLFSAEPPLECFVAPVSSPSFVPVSTTSGKMSGNSMGMGAMRSLSPVAPPVADSSVPVGGTPVALPASGMWHGCNGGNEWFGGNEWYGQHGRRTCRVVHERIGDNCTREGRSWQEGRLRAKETYLRLLNMHNAI